MQSKSTFLEFLRGIHRYKFGLPKKFFRGEIIQGEYCLESMEEYSECTIHKGEPEPRKGNVNTVYFINQARANTRIIRTEFIYDESMRLQMV